DAHVKVFDGDVGIAVLGEFEEEYDVAVLGELNIEPILHYVTDEKGSLAIEQLLEDSYLVYVTYEADEELLYVLKQIQVFDGQTDEITLVPMAEEVETGTVIVHLEEERNILINSGIMQSGLEIQIGLIPYEEMFDHMDLNEIWEGRITEAQATSSEVKFENVPVGEYKILINVNGAIRDIRRSYVNLVEGQERITDEEIDITELPFLGQWKFQSALNENGQEIDVPFNEMMIGWDYDITMGFNDNSILDFVENIEDFYEAGEEWVYLEFDFVGGEDFNPIYFRSFYYSLNDLSIAPDWDNLNNKENYQGTTLSFNVYDEENGNYVVTFTRDN
ncbi:hypothetical protein, partial [Xanthovirga aplysinae]|uniref:hypothetical protein n=1 Tax=Xanthovirga aplysinae TaxID=2529853 RepID=UPI00165719B1